MNRTITLICLIICVSAHAQKTEAFYSYNWQPCAPEDARFYSTIEKTDSGWFRNDYFLGTKSLQMRALYEDKDCKIMNGHCLFVYANGMPEATGRLIHGKEEGSYVRYYSNGMMADSAFYHDGKPVGSRLKWHRTGFMSDSIYHVNDSMDICISWFENGNIASAGYLLNGKNHNKWKFYHHNGNISGEVVFSKGVAISKSYFDENGNAQVDTSNANKEAFFKNGIKAWQTYLSKNLYWPPGLEFKNGNMAVVLVEFTINDQGKIENEEVIVPFHPEFDRIVLKTIHNGPAWIPATAQNRKVKMVIRQPVTFSQPED